MGTLSSKLVVTKKKDTSSDSVLQERNAALERDVLECNQKRHDAEEGWRGAQEDVNVFESYSKDLYEKYKQELLDLEYCNQTKIEAVNARDGWQENFRESDNKYKECSEKLDKHSSENNKLKKEIEDLRRDLQECRGDGKSSAPRVVPNVLTEARPPMASGLLAGIAKGTQLKKKQDVAQDSSSNAPKQMDLLRQIRQGASLQKTGERKAAPANVSPASTKKTLAEVIAEKTGQMRGSIADESDSDNEFFDDIDDYNAKKGKPAKFRSHRVSRSHRSPARRRRSPSRPAAKKKSPSARQGCSRTSRSVGSRKSRLPKQSPSARKRPSRGSRGSKSGKRRLY